jgi:hypothetical protein
MTNEQEIRAKALEISAAILGPAYKYGLDDKTDEDVILNKYRPLSAQIETYILGAASGQNE